MKTRTQRLVLGSAFALGVVVSLLSPRPASACAPAPRRGETIEIKREEALIVWNEQTKQEHFIRRAVFDTHAKSFGFLVPTPSRPVLAEASLALFDELWVATKPEVIEKPELRFIPAAASACFLTFARTKSASFETAAAAPRGVEVLEETRVAGMDASVLAATDTQALETWLTEREFEFRPALREWLKPYVDAGFIITAFRYSRPDVAARGDLLGAGVSPTAVRLTFPAERAFYPYREPSDTPDVPERALDVFLLSGGRIDGALANGAGWTSASVRYANPFTMTPTSTAALGGLGLGGPMWLTKFEDRATKRAPQDLFFRAAPNQSPVKPPPIIRYVGERVIFVPLDLMLLTTLGLIFWRRRKKRANAAPDA